MLFKGNWSDLNPGDEVIGSGPLRPSPRWYSGSGKAKAPTGYFVVSDRLLWYAIGASWVATSVSSEQIIGTVGMAYK